MKRTQRFFNTMYILLLAALLAACVPIAPQAPAAAEVPVAAEVAAPAPVTLTILDDDDEYSQAITKALVDAFVALHPNVTFITESKPSGSEGDNLVKTRLATGEMTDIFFYNTGSLLQALQPAETIVDITNDPYIANVADSFLPTVSQKGAIYGVPFGTAQGGGILYNKKVYENLELSIPVTWAEFAANNEVIKAAGIAPVIATFGDTWTSQLFVLADYYNVEQAAPTFAQDYTANRAKYATTPAAMAGFEHLQEGFEKGWWQQDFATTKFEQGLQMLADGEGAHYPMLSFALSAIATNSPDKIDDIGFFAQPGADASANGATIWMPGGAYISKTSKHIAEAKEFLAFIASTTGTDVFTAAFPPYGPYVIKGATLPEDVLLGVKDIALYIDSGNSAPALEFLSPVKGPSLEQICVAVGTGQMTAAEGAAAYDKDVEKQAQQLDLPGW